MRASIVREDGLDERSPNHATRAMPVPVVLLEKARGDRGIEPSMNHGPRIEILPALVWKGCVFFVRVRVRLLKIFSFLFSRQNVCSLLAT